MAKKFQAVRGMNDILPEAMPLWREIEATIQECTRLYNYQEIRFPIVENTQLFKRTIGNNTDIVEKEMYTFNDINGDSLTLRPEGTAGCVRACIENGLLHNQTQRLWYLGTMFRHERPQKGRYRQFHQFGVEALGFEQIDIDIEIILLSKKILKKLGLEKYVSLQINTIGTLDERMRHKTKLVEYFKEHANMLDTDEQNRIHSNPLRLLDSKNPKLKYIIQNAPKLFDYLDEASQKRFLSLQDALNSLDIQFEVNHHLVRGLDYYTHTVFEWVTNELGAQGTVCAGGRYDGLVEQLGGKPTPAIGFAMGLERIALLLSLIDEMGDNTRLSLYFITVGAAARKAAIPIAERLREAGYNIEMNCQDSSFKSQFKKADKSGASLALILGDDEVENKLIGIKPLRIRSEQISITQDELSSRLEQLLN